MQFIRLGRAKRLFLTQRRNGATLARFQVAFVATLRRCARILLWRWWSNAEWDLITLDAAHFNTYQQISSWKVVRKLDVDLRHPGLIRNVADVFNNQRIDGLLWVFRFSSDDRKILARLQFNIHCKQHEASASV